MGSAAELTTSLDQAFKVTATVHSAHDADAAIARATNYWIERHRATAHKWHIISVDLTLVSYLVSSMGPHHVTQKHLGVLKRFTLETFKEENTLAIYTSDAYTDSWVHAWCEAHATKVLEVHRKDAGPLIDLTQAKNPNYFYGAH